jgi:hypothetical protein
VRLAQEARKNGAVSDSANYWNEQAAGFDDAPDHGLRDPQTRRAWASLLIPLIGERLVVLRHQHIDRAAQCLDRPLCRRVRRQRHIEIGQAIGCQATPLGKDRGVDFDAWHAYDGGGTDVADRARSAA